jgi:ATP-dependent protease ClpP protease subunit/FtsZ-binding cell division protein ZapB
VQGIIKINGFIGSFPGPNGTTVKGVELIDVIAQVQAQPLATSFLVEIDSEGGSCKVGYDIHDYLTTLGLPITTQSINNCCSMGSIIMMAGEQRIGVEPLKFHPHNPYTSGLEGDATKLTETAEELRAIEDRMISTYAKATGISKEGIGAIMKMDKDIPLQKALELKFLTEIKGKNNMAEENKLIQTIEAKFKGLMKALKITPPLAMKATTTDGKEVEFLDAEGQDFEGEPMPGDSMTVAGEAANGTYSFENYTVEALMGVVTTVTPSEAAVEAKKKAETEKEEAEKKAALAKDADEVLRKENEELKAENKELKEFAEALGGKIDGLEKAVAVIKSNYVAPDGQTGFVARGFGAEVADLKKLATERKSLYKK